MLNAVALVLAYGAGFLTPVGLAVLVLRKAFR